MATWSHDVEPTALCVVPTQSWHSSGVASPSNSPIVPARHDSGAGLPSRQYAPRGQIWHCDAFCSPVAAANLPAGHGCCCVEPTGQKLPAPHSLHTTWPVRSWYVPAGHLRGDGRTDAHARHVSVT